ncbi:MAG: tRNA (adenosine(37)-N6)-threonylcarbamoyltransferase complex ATPase subunit type 1 TsaE [Thermoanaerobaculia bacterium]
MRSWVTTSVGETQALGQSLASELSPNGCLLLCGALGVGKTVLAQGVALGLGIDAREVQSPTFTIIREHTGESKLTHIDLYRLEVGELDSIGLDEILADSGVKVIEWADRWPFEVRGALCLDLELGTQPSHRRIAETANTLA